MDDERWWPAGRNLNNDDLRARTDLVSCILGPELHHALAEFIKDAESRGLKGSPNLALFGERLIETDGRPPTMLVHLVNAAVLADDRSGIRVKLEKDATDYAEVAYDMRFETLKFFGWLVQEAARRYGFDERTWALYLRSRQGAEMPVWPPQGVDYRPFPPQEG